MVHLCDEAAAAIGGAPGLRAMVAALSGLSLPVQRRVPVHSCAFVREQGHERPQATFLRLISLPPRKDTTEMSNDRKKS